MRMVYLKSFFFNSFLFVSFRSISPETLIPVNVIPAIVQEISNVSTPERAFFFWRWCWCGERANNCWVDLGKLETWKEKSFVSLVGGYCCANGILDKMSITQFNLESPVGQLLEQILRIHPHLLPVTVDEQLEKIATEKENLKAELSSTQDILSKRISEVRDKERRKTLAEIIYCLVVHRFVEKGISMIPQIKPTSDPAGRVDLWPNQEEKLEVIHSAEAFEMIQSHLSSALQP